MILVPRLLAVLCLLAMSAPALADGTAKRRLPKPTATASDAGLKGPVSPVAASPSPALSLPTPTPPGGSRIALQTLSLPDRTDLAPVCRSTCAVARIACLANEGGECDGPWARCVADCSAPAMRLR